MLKVLALVKIVGATQTLIVANTTWTRQQARDFHANNGLDFQGWNKASGCLIQNKIEDNRVVTYKLFPKVVG